MTPWLFWLNFVSCSDLVSFITNSTSPNGRFVVEQANDDVIVHDLLYRRNSARYPGQHTEIRRIAWEPKSVFFLTVSDDYYANLYSVGGGDHSNPYAQFVHEAPVLDAYCYDNEFYTLTVNGYGYRWFINSTGTFGETSGFWSDDFHSEVLSHLFIPETQTFEIFYQDGTMCRQEFISGSRQCYIPQFGLDEKETDELRTFVKVSAKRGMNRIKAEAVNQPDTFSSNYCVSKNSLDSFAMGFSVGVGAIIAVIYDLFGDVKRTLIPRAAYMVTLVLTILKYESLLEYPVLAFVAGTILTNPAILRSLMA